MRFFADFHIHSRYSRATSKELSPEGLVLWAARKGISLLGTGDFTHPGWLAELKEKLVEKESGLYALSDDLEMTVKARNPLKCRGEVRFILSGEISCIYKKNGRTRKVHHLVLMPSFESLERFTAALERIGNLAADGRPILGLDSRHLLEIALESDPSCVLIPAHIWTPWFSLFGSKSGFDSLEECFGDLCSHVRSVETGLSSDPSMNRLLSCLDGLNLVSNSDAHSPSRLGREATVFDTELNYGCIASALSNGVGLEGTIEFFPEEGKYHLDGHRKCGIRYEPSETMTRGEACPVCGHPLTVGVLNRVLNLADRKEPLLVKGFSSAIPLAEILSEVLSCGEASRRVTDEYHRLLEALGPELEILLHSPIDRIAQAGGEVIAEAVSRMREGCVIKDGGYDGQYGRIRLFGEGELERIGGQSRLFSMAALGPGPARPQVQIPLRTVTPLKAPQHSVSMSDPLLDHLNQEQLEAVTYPDRHLLVEAGPGTGKTLTLTRRLAYVIRKGLASPGEILALTFTRKAAEEMKRRVESLLAHEAPGKGAPYIATFHAFCLDLLKGKIYSAEGPGRRGLKKAPFTICHEWESERLARKALKDAGLDVRKVQSFLRAAGDLRRCPALSIPPRQESLTFSEAFRLYKGELAERGMMDYDDLEVEALRLISDKEDLFRANRLKFIFLDEYQDTNQVQAELVSRLARGCSATVFAIGDPDQSIYGFRDAAGLGLHDFIRRFPGAGSVVLRRNYRSSRTILHAAARLMGKERPLMAESHFDSPITIVSCRSALEEAEMVARQIERLVGGTSLSSFDQGRVGAADQKASYGFGDFAILYRLNAMGDAMEEAMDNAAIPFVRSGERPLAARHPVDLILMCLRVICSPDNACFRRDYNEAFPGRSLDQRSLLRLAQRAGGTEELIDLILEAHSIDGRGAEEALGKLRQYASESTPESLIDLICLDKATDHSMFKPERVSLMTMHAAKGLEWPVVFVAGCEEGLIPCSVFGARDGDEEKRLFYVSITRAKERLFLSHAPGRYLQGMTVDRGPSPFLSLIPPELCSFIDMKAGPRRPRQMRLFPSGP